MFGISFSRGPPFSGAFAVSFRESLKQYLQPPPGLQGGPLPVIHEVINPISRVITPATRTHVFSAIYRAGKILPHPVAFLAPSNAVSDPSRNPGTEDRLIPKIEHPNAITLVIQVENESLQQTGEERI